LQHLLLKVEFALVSALHCVDTSATCVALPRQVAYKIGDLHDGIILLPLPECFANFLSYSDFYFHKNSKTIGTNGLTKESRQSILVVVVK
jgi:hypothetical protein